MRPLHITLIVIGVFQLILGALFLLAPGPAANLLDLSPPAPPWVNWLFATMAARYLGYAYGMFIAARAPQDHVGWINTMIVIQAIDWVATIGYVLAAGLSLRQVTTAAFVPVLFIGALLWFHPRRLRQPRSDHRATDAGSLDAPHLPGALTPGHHTMGSGRDTGTTGRPH